jgi:RNA polymerase sigma-70 factor, ECF subfamily
MGVDAAPSRPEDEIALAPGEVALVAPEIVASHNLPQSLVDDLWSIAEAEACGLAPEEFAQILATVGAKHNFGLPSGPVASPGQRESFLRSLHLAELALAHACALGREAAWERFLDRCRAMLVQSAIAITGSETLGRDLADSLHAELFGLRASDAGERRSPFASYSGRGSLAGWLRTTLAQRFRDHHRRTHRESPLEEIDCPAPDSTQADLAELERLGAAVTATLHVLEPEDRFLLSAYYLDQRTLLQIARILSVHEATISRRLKRLVIDVRKQLIANLQRGGMSKRAAEEALGADPRDIEINLRKALQSCPAAPFSTQAASPPQTASSPASETR